MDVKKVYIINKLARLPYKNCKGDFAERINKAQYAFDTVMSGINKSAEKDPPLRAYSITDVLNNTFPSLCVQVTDNPCGAKKSFYSPLIKIYDSIRRNEVVEMHRMTNYNLNFGELTPKRAGYEISKFVFDLYNPKAVMRHMFKDEKSTYFFNNELLKTDRETVYFPNAKNYSIELITKIKKYFRTERIDGKRQINILQDWRYSLYKEKFALNNSHESIKLLGKGTQAENYDYFANKYVTRNRRYDEKIEVINKMLSRVLKEERAMHKAGLEA